MTDLTRRYSSEIATRLAQLDDDFAAGGFDAAIDIMERVFRSGGVMQAFGTGHSEAFAMEIAGRAGGFIPTNHITLKDLFLIGPLDDTTLLGTGEFERDETIADKLWELYEIKEHDAVIIASNSGGNGSVVHLALRAKAEGLPLIAVTSLEHSRGITSRHSSGKRLFEIADVVIDNRAPFGDTTLPLADGLKVGAVSSITAAYIAQLLTVATAERINGAGEVPPVYISANIPGGDEHNHALQARYGRRISPYMSR